MLEIAKIQKKDNKSTSQRDNKFFFNIKSESLILLDNDISLLSFAINLSDFQISRFSDSSLSYCFKDYYCSSYRNIQRVGDAVHRDYQVLVCCVDPSI